MKKVTRFPLLKGVLVCSTVIIACLACLVVATAVSRCDTPIGMAPPLAGAGDPSTVFNWSEIPQNQQVTITRAVFDQGGYQLYDTVGETIVVPFVNNNLYVMQFAKSTNGLMQFVNNGSTPILYVPRGGYLENATVPGARWYPFTRKFHPTTPVFLGIAPSWRAFIAMGWYPDMICHGGYWANSGYGVGLFVVTDGFVLEIGGYTINDWRHYHQYWTQYTAPYRIGYYNRDIYNNTHGSISITGGGHIFGGGRISVGGTINGNNGGNRIFRGAGNGGNFSGGGNNNSGRTFRGIGGSSNGGWHGFTGGTSSPSGGHTPGGNVNNNSGSQSGNSTGGHSFKGVGGSSSTGSGNNSTGGHTFGGGNTGGSDGGHNSGSGGNSAGNSGGNSGGGNGGGGHDRN